MQAVSSVQRPQAFSSRPCSVRPARRGVQVVAMAKKGIHPEWHAEAKVLCNGEEVLTTSGTQGTYTVDIWSGNHPFFQGNQGTVVTDEGRVNRFKRRFAGLDSLSAGLETLSGQAAKKKEEAAAGAQ